MLINFVKKSVKYLVLFIVALEAFDNRKWKTIVPSPTLSFGQVHWVQYTNEDYTQMLTLSS